MRGIRNRAVVIGCVGDLARGNGELTIAEALVRRSSALAISSGHIADPTSTLTDQCLAHAGGANDHR